MKETVYIYNINDKNKIRNMQFALLRLKIKLKVISDDMLLQKVGCIAELDGFEPETPLSSEIPEITDEIMLMKNLTSSRIDALLSAFRKAGVTRIKLKAILTETNKDWYFADLHKELLREHHEMSKQDPPGSPGDIEDSAAAL